jgi:hypothetical protein
MPPRTLQLGIGAALLLFAACATAPVPSTPRPAPAPLPVAPPPAPKAAAEPEPPQLFCGPHAIGIAFKDLKLAPHEEPVDVALTSRYVWVLLQPDRVLRIDRVGHANEPARVESVPGPAGEVWTGMDADPLDGSVWVVSEEFVFRRISPDLASTAVPLQRKVRGKSGFARLLVAADALYAAPICGDYGVWRIDRKGKVLDTAFPIEHRPDEILEPDTMPCAKARIERDRDGSIVARNGAGKFFRAGAEGWKPEETDLFAAAPGTVVRSTRQGRQGKGRAGEYYYAAGFIESLFFWKGKPAFLGAGDSEVMNAGLGIARFYVPDPSAGPKGRKVFPARCAKESILDVATDDAGYAAITPTRLFFGDFATAPDLP